MKHSFKNPLFILGYPRSGTTLLRALLGSHTKISLMHEPELIRGMRFAGISISEVIERESYPHVLERLQKVSVCRRHLSTLSSEKISELINYPEDLSFREIYEFLLPKPDDVEIWGEKSLGNVFYIPEIYKLYPKAIFVHIVRDPRAALLSHYRKKFAASADCLPTLDRKGIRFFAHGAIRWKKWLEAVNEARQNLDETVIIQTRYRDLVTEPEKEMRRICSAVGVNFEPEMLAASHRKNDPVMLPGGVYGTYAHQNLTQTINPKRAMADKELPDWASYIVEKYVASDLENLGFDSNKKPIGIANKIKIEMELLLAEKKIYSKVSRNIDNRKGLNKNFSFLNVP